MSTPGKAGKAGLLVRIFVLLLFWGSFSAISKLTLGSMDSYQLQLYMFAFAALIQTGLLLARGELRAAFCVASRDWLPTLVSGVTMYLYYFLYTLALAHIPAVEASMLNYLFPVMIVLFAVPINREKFTLRVGLSVLLGFLGTAIILTGGNLTAITLSNLGGDLLALGAAVCWGLFSNLSKRSRLGLHAGAYLYTLIGLGLSCVSLVCFSRFTVPGALPALGIAWLALSNLALSLPLWIQVLQAAPVALAASFSFITPFVTLVFIVLLTGETMSAAQAAGLLVILGAIAVQQVRLPLRKGKGAADTTAAQT